MRGKTIPSGDHDFGDDQPDEMSGYFTKDLFYGRVTVEGKTIWVHHIGCQEPRMGHTYRALRALKKDGYDLRVVMPNDRMQRTCGALGLKESWEKMPGYYKGDVEVWK